MEKQNLLQTVHFDTPQAIPVIFHINPSCWDHYPRESLANLVLCHPLLFPEGVPEFVTRNEAVPYAPWCLEGIPWTDPWGCVWETTTSGFIGSVVKHPLADLELIETYIPPSPQHTTHWYPVSWEKGKAPHGGSIGFFDCLRSGEIGHGHTFLKLTDILGYENALCGLFDADQRVLRLLGMLEDFNYSLVRNFIEYADVEWMGYAEDLGMQVGPLVSPDLFRRYILPSYQRIMAPAQEHGAIIHMHSDGDIKTLSSDLLRLPVQVLNIQDRVNGLDWIARNLKGRVTLDLDIDRQHITPTGTPTEIREYLREVLKKLYDPAGGLILTFGLYPGTPIENVKMLMDVLEHIAEGQTSWST